MGFVALKCPSCGADIEIDDSREFGFCSYCGTKIMQDKIVVEHKGSITVDRSNEINNFLVRAANMMKMGNFEDAERYYNRVLDYDYNNKIANDAIQELYKIIRTPNLFLSVATGFGVSKTTKIKVYIDNKKVGKLQVGTSQEFTLMPGEHELAVKFAAPISTKSYKQIIIKDRFTKIRLTLKCPFFTTGNFKFIDS